MAPLGRPSIDAAWQAQYLRRLASPANARIGDKDDPICNETHLLVKTADGTLGWLIVDFGGDNYPSIDGLHPLAG